ncbi:AAA family ATPase [Kineococcus sp. SYSU DK006]|uniref:AAA family ATPase n=1 Tax=Kineococcus sp. SYSU DK006 TaxID=3383127 RepID=UPI003D7ED23A
MTHPPGVPLPRAVVVLVGAAASGKTTLRRRWVAAGLDPGCVVSLDDLRRRLRAEDLHRGAADRGAQAYTLPALRRAARRCDALAGFGVGYLADATHLRRSERRVHVARAAAAGLPAVAVLLPALDVAQLLRRDASRAPEERVPADVLARHAHRRSLLSADGLRADGFEHVLEEPGEPGKAGR